MDEAALLGGRMAGTIDDTFGLLEFLGDSVQMVKTELLVFEKLTFTLDATRKVDVVVFVDNAEFIARMEREWNVLGALYYATGVQSIHFSCQVTASTHIAIAIRSHGAGQVQFRSDIESVDASGSAPLSGLPRNAGRIIISVKTAG